MAAHRCSTFAQKQLEKHGWQTGQGLGRTESGISEAIKVKIKHDTAGVGHDLGEQFTYHWWDHVFNKAANNIVVENNQEGVKLTSKEASQGPISNRKQSKNAGKKPLLYGNFVRSATLTSEGLKKDDKDISSSEEEESNTEETNIDDRFFKACGGRTAHKGARHGLTLSGKLKRIQEQEDGYPNRRHKKHQAQSADPPPTRPDEYHSQTTKDDVDGETLRDAGGEENRDRKQRKKDKKRKMKASIDNERCDSDGITLYTAREENDGKHIQPGSEPESGKAPKEKNENGDEDDESNIQQEKKRRKKDRKRKMKEDLVKSANSCHDDTTDLGDNMVITNDEAVLRKQAKKARKELKLKSRLDRASCGENLNGLFVEDAVKLTQGENEEERDRKQRKKKEKRRKKGLFDICDTNENEVSERICNSATKGDTRTSDEYVHDIRNDGDDLGKKTKKRRKEQLLHNGSHSHQVRDIKTSRKKKKSKH